MDGVEGEAGRVHAGGRGVGGGGGGGAAAAAEANGRGPVDG